MPSYDVRCFASEQTVSPGDRCRLLPVSLPGSFTGTLAPLPAPKGGLVHATSTADSPWRPAGGLFPVEYAGNGDFKLVLADDNARAQVLTFFRSVLQRSPNRPGPVDGGRFDFRNFLERSARSVLEAISAGPEHQQAVMLKGDDLDSEIGVCWEYLELAAKDLQLFTRSNRGELQPVDFAVLHEDVYQSLVASTAAKRDAGGLPLEQSGYLATKLADALGIVRMQATCEPAVKQRAWRVTEALLRSTSALDPFNTYPRTVESAFLQALAERLLSNDVSEVAFVEAYLPFLNDRYAIAALNADGLRIVPMACPVPDEKKEVVDAYTQATAAAVTRATADAFSGY